MEQLLAGFINALQPFNFLMLLLAIIIGFLGGAMPGISGLMLIVVLIPVTFGMDPIPAFVLLTGIYAAAAYSGSISAILFRIPGTPEAIATSFDGYPMAQKGQAGLAMGLSMTSSAIGGLIGAIFLMFLTPILSSFALRFSSPEYFALAVMGLCVVASLCTKDIVRGLLSVLLGLFLATVGMDVITSVNRFTFGTTSFRAGISLAPVMIGMMGIGEIIKNSRKSHGLELIVPQQGLKTKLFAGKILRQCTPVMMIASLLGVIIGILPGVGGTTAAILAYSQAAGQSKRPEEFGKGAPEGIVAPEAANNSAATTSFIPLFSLGIPGSSTAAVILGVFIMHGLQPGPMMMVNQPKLAYTIFAGLFLINILMLILCKPLIRIFVRIKDIPYSYLAPLIIVFCFIGTYSVSNNMLNVWVMMVFGIVGYFMDKIDFPISPMVIGLVLGPLVETEFRRSLLMSNGDYTTFFTRPICLVLLVTAFISLAIPILKGLYQSKKKLTADTKNL